MVFFMEGSNARDKTISYCGGEQTRVDDKMMNSLDEETLPTLPLENIDSSLVYNVDELNLTMLASGFFGEVYKVYHKRTDRTMVLKKDRLSVEDRSFCENDLMTEAAILSRMCHPNVVRFMGLCIGNEGDQTHLLIEYINGGNLEELLMNHNEVLDWGTRVYLARDIADGMSYLHSKRIIHRDLASKNCLIKIANGVRYAVVADFGLATYLPDNGEGVQTVVGSPYNMAPELLRGETYDNKADVFSFGIIMCEIIGRVQADPDELPRTRAFGLDVGKFQAMVGDCPMEFLHTAVCCCQMDPRTRPSFAATVKQLELILIDYPRRPDIPIEPLLHGENVIDSQTRDTVCESDAWSTNTSSSSSSSLLSPGYILKDGTCHRHRSNSENKRRLSWISRHKLFHSATDDLLKSTPAKLMGFFKNVLGLRSKEMSVHAKGRTLKDSADGSRNLRGRSQSSILTRVSPLPKKDLSPFNYDLNKNKSDFEITKQSKSETCETPPQSASCPGTPGSSKKKSPRRHTISPSSPVYSDIPDFNLSISSENSTCIASGKHGTQSDVVSMSSGFASMPDTSSLCTSNNESTSFTESDFSSRTSSLRKQTSLSTEDEEDQLISTPTCKNIKTPHFDRYGSYSVVNAEASSRLAFVKETEKDKLEGLTLTSADNVKAKRRLRSPTLLSFLLGNRGKSKDAL